MTFLEVSQPKWSERALVIAVQGVFFNAYFAAYLISPKLAHRIVGYLEEEAVNSYTEFLEDLEKGLVENQPAPAIAIDYWRLPADSTLKDVVTVIRADEAHHRDLNHYASVLTTNFFSRSLFDSIFRISLFFIILFFKSSNHIAFQIVSILSDFRFGLSKLEIIKTCL